MAIVSSPQDFNEDQLFVDLEPVVGQSLFLKIEGMNFAGSVKLKAAGEMVAAAERDGLLKPRSVLVESSSGNLGVALSMIAASKGYGFLCVTDSRCNLATRLLMEALGAQVHMITEADPVGGDNCPAIDKRAVVLFVAKPTPPFTGSARIGAESEFLHK